MMYNSVSDDYIRQVIDKRLTDLIFTPCYNLSAIIGDIDGMMMQSTTKNVVKGLDIIDPGIVLIGESTGIEVSTTFDALPEDVYIRDTSSECYTMYNQFKSLDPNVVVSMTNGQVSTILTLSTNLHPTLQNAIRMLFIEAVVVYYELLNATLESGVPNLLKSDLTRIDNNIRWVCNYLEGFDIIPYDLVEILRDLQVTCIYVRSLDQLFDTTYYDKMSELQGGVF